MSAIERGILSMTGHGVGEAPLAVGRVMIEIRTVNHRYLDARVRLPMQLAEHTAVVEERVRAALRRGRIELVGRIDGDVCGPPTLDLERARAAYLQLCQLRDDLRPEEPVPLSLLACVPDLFQSRSAADYDAARGALEQACDRACEAVWKMRAREGEALAADLRGHLAQLAANLELVRERAPQVVEGYRERLRLRIERLLTDLRSVALDPNRLEHEVALFADRADVAEEIARLTSHIEQMRELLSGQEPSAGRQLDFLLQEMTRETNTIGAKSTDASLARLVVEMKAAVSRMREQAQNVL